jgi:small GTP-binding protein
MEQNDRFDDIGILRASRAMLTRMAWSPDGLFLAAGSLDQYVRVWDVRHEQPVWSQEAHRATIGCVAWSTKGLLATGSDDRTIGVVDASNGQHGIQLEGHTRNITSVSWSPDGDHLASGADDYTMIVWDLTGTGEPKQTLSGHLDRVLSVVWSPDGTKLASGSFDETVRLWHMDTLQPMDMSGKHAGPVYCVAWSPDSRWVASGSEDRTVGIWDAETGSLAQELEKHSDAVTSVSFSADGRLMASRSLDGSIILWSCEYWRPVDKLEEYGNWPYTGAVFHPREPILATLARGDTVVQLLRVDVDALLENLPTAPAAYYVNAKVVLVGDSGVGKSTLRRVLTGRPYLSTEDSTHGRVVRSLWRNDVKTAGGETETREILLWDLAGQPDFRVVHQLSLDQVSTAIVVFDAQNAADPLAGVRHWARSLDQAQQLGGASPPLMTKLLVAARDDVGHVSVSKAQIEAFKKEFGFDGYIETSAKINKNIDSLRSAVLDSIRWEALVKVSSSDLFQQIKSFLSAQLTKKEPAQLLSTVEELYRSFLQSKGAPPHSEELRADFDTCIVRLEARGLVRRLSFGEFVLLKPELLDAYAAAIVNEAGRDPSELGTLLEDRVRAGQFTMTGERISNPVQERLLIIAAIEDLIRFEIALRERHKEGVREYQELVFPSQLRREHPEMPEPEGKTLVLRFEGNLLNIYATLIVRLSRSSIFQRQEMWKNAATFTEHKRGGTFGVLLNEIEEGKGEIVVFFNTSAAPPMRGQFEHFVRAHVGSRAVFGSFTVRRVPWCPRCKWESSNQTVTLAQERGQDFVFCGVCGDRISFSEPIEQQAAEIGPAVKEMEVNADEARRTEEGITRVSAVSISGNYDVFLAHNTLDKPAVREVSEHLKRRRINPWIDIERILPGEWILEAIQEAIQNVEIAVIFFGPTGTGRWQKMELYAFMKACVEADKCVIPVLLPGVVNIPRNLPLLEGIRWVRFKQNVNEPEPLDELVAGIRRCLGRPD